MVQKKYFNYFIILLLIIILQKSLIARWHGHTKLSKQNNVNIEDRTLLNASNWSYWIYASGKSAGRPNGNSGGIYPWGTAGVIYLDGLMWGGKFAGKDDDIRVGGGFYNTGTIAGWINDDGSAVSSDDERIKIWRIRKDYKNMTEREIKKDAMDLFELSWLGGVTDDMLQEVVNQYNENWENWPVDLGAPFYDLDNDGIYEPDADGDGVKWNSLIDEKPGIANADQVIWCVFNDLDEIKVKFVAGSKPIGLEIQLTAWTYSAPKEKYGQIVFKKYKVINKSGEEIKEMYLSQWSDPDIGYYGNDFVGCDTLLNIGFGYNAFATDDDFKSFGLPPAAVGYDILQGPLIDGIAGEDQNKNGIDDVMDFGEVNFQKVGPGKINLAMTTFGWFGIGDYLGDPALGEYDGTLQFYNMMRGYKNTSDIENPTPWKLGNIDSNITTKYPLSGDPVIGIGDIDGKDNYNSPGDRRMLITSGPFDLANNETQEIIIAIVGGLGYDNLSSISDMKNNDKVAQIMYDKQFTNVPQTPFEPQVVIKPFENKILIEWGSDQAEVDELENPTHGNFEFEGYNVYQFSKPSGKDIELIKIATFDKKNGITGNMGENFHFDYYRYEYEVCNYYSYWSSFYPDYDSGLKRYIIINKDHFTRNPLYEGKTYYYGVTAYSHNPNSELVEDKILISPMKIYSVTVQEEKPGTRYNSQPGDFLTTYPDKENIEVKIIDPSVMTGHEYVIFFSTGNNDEFLWNVKDINEDKTVLYNQPILNILSESDAQPIFHGLQVKVARPIENISERYTFGTPFIESNEEIAKEDVNKINVYPNPYYAHNDLGTHRYANFVTLTHLPEKAEIRIFNLAGIQLRVIKKNDPSQFLEWDLCNANNLQVGSGIYIIRIYLPDLKQVKILKLYVIQKQLILKYF